MTVEVGQYFLQSLKCGDLFAFGGIFVGKPLRHVQLVCIGFRLAVQEHSYVIEAFEGAYRRGAHCHATAAVGYEPFYAFALHGYPFRVHGVAGYLVAFHRLERACSNVQCHFVTFYLAGVEGGEYAVCKM